MLEYWIKQIGLGSEMQKIEDGVAGVDKRKVTEFNDLLEMVRQTKALFADTA